MEIRSLAPSDEKWDTVVGSAPGLFLGVVRASMLAWWKVLHVLGVPQNW